MKRIRWLNLKRKYFCYSTTMKNVWRKKPQCQLRMTNYETLDVLFSSHQQHRFFSFRMPTRAWMDQDQSTVCPCVIFNCFCSFNSHLHWGFVEATTTICIQFSVYIKASFMVTTLNTPKPVSCLSLSLALTLAC